MKTHCNMRPHLWALVTMFSLRISEAQSSILRMSQLETKPELLTETLEGPPIPVMSVAFSKLCHSWRRAAAARRPRVWITFPKWFVHVTFMCTSERNSKYAVLVKESTTPQKDREGLAKQWYAMLSSKSPVGN